jgi:hypothetical protein
MYIFSQTETITVTEMFKKLKDKIFFIGIQYENNASEK